MCQIKYIIPVFNGSPYVLRRLIRRHPCSEIFSVRTRAWC